MRTTGQRLRPLGLIVLLLLLPVLLGEVAIRGLVALHRLPVAAAHLGNVEYAWANLERRDRTDIVLFGDSMTQQGIDPKALADALAPALGHRPSAFTLASPGGGFGVNMALAQQLAREGRLPSVAIVGVSYSSIETDGTFQDAFAPSPMGEIFTDCRLQTALEDLLSCRASQASMLWRWRGRMKQVLTSIVRPLKTSDVRAGGGFVIRPDGFREGKPSTIAQIQAQVPEALGHQPAVLKLGNGVEDSYVQLIRALVEGGATVVAVAVPVSPVYQGALATARPDWETQRTAAVATLSAASALPIVDPLAFGAWWGDGASRDVNHLSKIGAPQFAQQLVSIPEFRDPILARLLGK